MTEWGVVGVIVVLIGLFASIAAPLIKLNVSIAKLDLNIANLNKELTALTTRNSDTHDRIFKRLDEDEDTIKDHETRITVIEKKL